MATPYCTNTDLEDACGGTERFVEAFDWDNDGVVDQARIDAAILAADREIDTYIHKQKLVPLTAPIPPHIVKLSARRAIYYALDPRGMLGSNELRRYEQDTRWLEGVSRGEISVGVEPEPTQTTMRVDSSIERPTSKSVSRKKLFGFR